MAEQKARSYPGISAGDILGCRNNENDGKLPKFVRDGIKTAIQNAKLDSANTVTNLISLSGYSPPVISLPYLVDADGEINQVAKLAKHEVADKERQRI